jgi:hypothetical protein
MSETTDRLRSALLDLGMEDWIPIPEALTTPEVRGAIGDKDATTVVSGALAALVETGQVRLYRGAWNTEPSPLTTTEALSLLNDPYWLRFHTDDPQEERLYFVNVANIRDT